MLLCHRTEQSFQKIVYRSFRSFMFDGRAFDATGDREYPTNEYFNIHVVCMNVFRFDSTATTPNIERDSSFIVDGKNF